MLLGQSRVTAQGQVSVPAKVRQRLGIGPGSILEWQEAGNAVLVRRSGTFSSEDIHEALFPTGPKPKSLEQIKQGIGRALRKKYARR